MTPGICPVCGRPAELPGIRVFLKENLIVADGDVARLQPREAEIADRLVAAMPRTVSKAELMDALYGASSAKPALKILDIFICKLRQATRHLPIRIVTTRCVGWRIELAGTAAPASAQANGGTHAALR